jgi:SEC-C motif-containing protein
MLRAMMASCPCASGRPYDACCARYHAGEEPPDAETLMRSRYAAFVRGDHAYLFRTLHREHEDHAAGAEAYRVQLARAAKRTRYDGLRVLDHDGPDADGIARVLFHVTMRFEFRDASFAELSSFVFDGGWRYVGGITRRMAAAQAEGMRIATFVGR